MTFNHRPQITPTPTAAEAAAITSVLHAALTAAAIVPAARPTTPRWALAGRLDSQRRLGSGQRELRQQLRHRWPLQQDH